MVLKYHSALHRYIQTKMEFLDISSLGAAYRYAVKIEQKIKKRHDNLGLETPHNKRQERAAPKHRTKMGSIRTTSPSRKQRTPERQIKIPGSGATSKRALGITLLTIAQRRCWWPKLNLLNQMQIMTLSQNQKGEDGSLTWNPVPPLLPPRSNLVNQTSEKKESTSSIYRCG